MKNLTSKQVIQFNQLLTTLKVISKEYSTPAQLRKRSEKSYGLGYEEALEMAYENIQQLAASAAKGVKFIK